MKKQTFVLAGVWLAGSAMMSAQELVAGWDTWENGATPTASRVMADVTGTAITTTEGLNWNVNDERGASADGDWGSVVTVPPASTVTDADGENLELSNATSGGTVTFTITNNGTEDIVLGSFNFDSYAFRPRAARTYELSVVEGGGITSGIIYTSGDQEIPHVAGSNDNMAHADIDHSLTDLADHTLAPGETVDFLLAFSGGAGDASGGHDLWLDNVAVFDTSVVEPVEGITNVQVTKEGADVNLSFSFMGGVDVYRSTDLQNWALIASDQSESYFDEVDDAPAYFYLLVPTGQPLPQ